MHACIQHWCNVLSEQVSSDNLLSDRAKPSRRYNHDGMDVDNSACHYGCETACSVVLPRLARLLPIKFCALSNIAEHSYITCAFVPSHQRHF